MNKLTTEVLNELKLSIFNEEMAQKNLVVVYPGRFQPFHINHMYSYDWLVTQFGRENVYIATSNATDTVRSPFTFFEKKRIIEKYGIQNIIQVKRPYNVFDTFTALGDKYDPNVTMLIYAIGEKDQTRLGKRATKFNKTTYIPAGDLNNPYIYVTILPNSKFTFNDSNIISGTSARTALSDKRASLSVLKKRFKTIFGWFDDKIFKLVMSKLNPNKTLTNESVSSWASAIHSMTRTQFKMFVDLLHKEYGDTVELLPIIKKWMTKQPITDKENEIFKKQMVDIMKMIGLGTIVLAPIPLTTFLIPLLINVGKKFNINVLPHDDEMPASEHNNSDKKFWSEVSSNLDEEADVISEGGAYGHIQHIFDDNDLTFDDIRRIFESGLSGRISVENDATEKTDGMNLMFTFKSNNLYAARNKSDIKNGGATIQNMSTRFAGRGTLKNAFIYAMMDLQEACRKLTDSQRKMIFKDGKSWMSCEVIYPESPNVINYDGAHLIFHGAFEYNERGEIVAYHFEFEKLLSDMIKNTNANSQKVFTIRGQFRPKIEQSKDFSKKLEYFNTQLSEIRDITKCKDTDTLGTWHRRWWTFFIKTNVETKFGMLDPTLFDKLLNRWSFDDKSFRINGINISNNELLLWIKDFEATKLHDIRIKNYQLFDILALKFGAEVLTNVKTFMSSNPTKTVDKLRNELDTAIDILKKSTDPKDIAVFKTQLQRIEAAGGLEKIVPIEGLVFQYKGKTYKITGLFAPINQILGYFKYS